MSDRLPSMRKKTASATEILRKRYLKDDPSSETLLAQEIVNARIAGLIYEVRTSAGLTQQELASRLGTQKSVISRLEDADYEGHSLGMLRRIAETLGLRVEISFQPIDAPAPGKKKQTPARKHGKKPTALGSHSVPAVSETLSDYGTTKSSAHKSPTSSHGKSKR